MERHEKNQDSRVCQAEAEADVARRKASKVKQYRNAAEQDNKDAKAALRDISEQQEPKK